MTLRRRYVDHLDGQVHVTSVEPSRPAPDRRPVVLLHQTPRSADEFAEVLVDLGAERVALALDLPGMGGSSPLAAGASIEGYAAAVVAVVEALGAGPVHLVGHHTGGVVAIEIAATRPDLVDTLVLSSTPWVDAAARARRRATAHTVDDVALRPDGGHALDLVRGRADFYPADRPDLLQRFLVDALRADDPAAGHRAVGRYEMESRLARIGSPTLLLGHDADPFAFDDLGPLADALADAGVTVGTTVIEGGMVPLEYRAAKVAATVRRFCHHHEAATAGSPAAIEDPPPGIATRSSASCD